MPTHDDSAGQGALAGLRIDKAALGRRRRRGWLWLVVLLAVLAGGGFWLQRSGLLTPALQVRAALVSSIYPYQTFTVQTASGYVVAQRKAAVGAKTTALLTELKVEEGQRVRAGQIIARQESRTQAAALNQARASLVAAEKNLATAQAERVNAELQFKRYRNLVAADVVARADFDAAKQRIDQAVAGVAARSADIAAAEAAVRQAEVALDDTLVRAPFDAVVLTKDADVGDIVTPLGAAAGVKASVVSIADMNSLQVEADVAESSISRITTGQPAQIQLDSLPGEHFDGRVHMIVPTADRSKASVKVKVAFVNKDPRTLPDMSAKVAFLSRPVAEGERTAVLAVPGGALTSRDGRTVAFVVEGQTARMVLVTTGRELGDQREILSGLTVGQRVVLGPAPALADGAKIQVQE